jgi:hypothetical protein
MDIVYYLMATSVQPSIAPPLLSTGDVKECLLHEVIPRCIECNQYEALHMIQEALDDLAAKVGVTDTRVIPHMPLREST